MFCTLCVVSLIFGGYYLKSSSDNKNSITKQQDNNIISDEQFIYENEDVLQEEDLQEKDSSVQNEVVNQQPIEEPVHEDPINNTPQISEIRQQVQNELIQVEQQAATIEQNLNSTSVQLDMNQYSGQLFQVWDDYINVLWGYLEDNLSESEFNTLKKEQIDWIINKENAMERAGDEFKGGSMEIYARNIEGINYTKQRVYELVGYLP